MTSTTATRTFSLAIATTKRIPDPAGLVITCTSGSIWITLEGIMYDVILAAGTADDTFVTRSHRSALIYALDDSEIVLATRSVATGDAQPAERSGHGDSYAKMLPAAAA